MNDELFNILNSADHPGANVQKTLSKNQELCKDKIDKMVSISKISSITK